MNIPEQAEQHEVFNQDKYLLPYSEFFQQKFDLCKALIQKINQNEQSLTLFAQGYKSYGLNESDECYTYKEWAPGAKEVYLFGEFNNWNRKQFKCQKDDFGNHFLQLKKSEVDIKHNSLVKVHVLNDKDIYEDKVPAYITFTKQNPETF